MAVVKAKRREALWCKGHQMKQKNKRKYYLKV